MNSPRLFIRVNGEIPPEHAQLGYRVPFELEPIKALVEKFTEGKEWRHIQIRVISSMLTASDKVILISSSLKVDPTNIENSVFLMNAKTKQLLYSATSLEELFEIMPTKEEVLTK